MHINPHTILPIFTMFLSLLVGIFVIYNNNRPDINRIFFILCLTLTIWFSYYLLPNFKISEHLFLTFTRIIYAVITFVPIMTFTFVTKFLNMERFKRWFIINLIIGFMVVFLTIFTKLIISGLVYYPWYPFPKAGPLHFIFLVHTLYLLTYMIIILNKAKKIHENDPKLLNQTKYVRIACYTLCIGAIDLFPNYGIPLYPVAYIPGSAFLLIISYAILKYEFLDIKIVIRKSLIYSIFVSSITIIFSTVILVFEHLSQYYFGYKSLFISILASFILALFIIPLRNKIQYVVDRLFFKNTQQEIMEQNELLKREVAKSDRMKSIAILASGMAHEIKNPLTPIKTFSEQLPSRLDDKEFLLKFSRIINKEVDRIDSLVQELLSFAKPSLPQLKQVNIYQLIGQTLDLLNNEIIRHKINLNTSFENKNILINIDPQQIKQALLNIFLNAIDAMPNGGTLSVIASEAKQSLTIEISDTGCGINPKDMRHIFDPFFSKKDHGTGLGLSITHEIIKNHNGRILAESELDKGTTFRIELSL